MVRVISAHHFDSQIVQTCEKPLAVTTVPPERLLIALPHHVIEVRDLSANGKTILSFPTVDRVSFLNYCVAGIGTIRKCKTQSSTVKVSKQASEILEYYSKSVIFQENIQYISKKFLVRKAKPSSVFFADESSAKQVADAIQSDLQTSSDPVFEANPGFGLLTRHLLKLNLNKLCLFESDPLFKIALCKLQSQYPNKFKIYPANILELWKITFMDKLDNGTRLKGLMKDVPVRKWEDAPSVRIIGAVPSSVFINSVINSLVFQIGITNYGRPQLFVLLNPYQYFQIKKIIKVYSILFNIFFDWECLTEVNGRCVLPWVIQKKTLKEIVDFNKKKEITKYYLIKATPKKHLYKIVSPYLMKPLLYFLRFHLHNTHDRVIPSLEKWVPNCGPRLISKGFDVFTQFRELSPEQLLIVFHSFTEWPEFAHSPFLSAMDDYFAKTEWADPGELPEDTSMVIEDNVELASEQRDDDEQLTYCTEISPETET